MKKIFLFFLLLLQCSIPLFAQSNDEQKSRGHIIGDFSKGLASHKNDYVTGPNEASATQNMRFNGELASLTKREILIDGGDVGSNKITGLHRYYKSDNTQRFIVSSGDTIYIRDDDDNTFQTAKSSITEGRRWEWVTYKNIAIGMNGFDNAVKYDGSVDVADDTVANRTSGHLMADLGAPFADLEAGSDLSASGWYQYKVAFFDGSNWDYSNARSNPIQVGFTVQNITLSDIPLGNTGTTTRVLFRSQGQDSLTDLLNLEDSDFSHVLTLSNNISTSVSDNVADGSLGAGVTWSTISVGVNVTPPKGSYPTIHKERLFIAGNKTFLSDIYYSDEFNPDHFLPSDFLQIRPDDGDKITFLKDHFGILTVGKTNTISKIYVEGADTNWTIRDSISHIGCPAPYSAVSTPIGIIYLGRYGLFRFDGQRSILISDFVTEEIRDIQQANIEEVYGIHWNNEYHMAYTSDESGDAKNNRVLVYDIVRGAFTVDTKNINVMETFESGLDFGVLYAGSSDDDGKIYAIGASETFLLKRYKSELDEGTFDDTRTFGDELDPMLKLAWDVTVSGHDFETIENLTTEIVLREDKDGFWVSPVEQINASELNKLFWNENLNGFGDIEARVRVGATEAATLAASYSSAVTDPSGSDLSAIVADDFIQVRFDLSTSDIVFTPELFFTDTYIYRLVYNKQGSNAETSVSSFWESGWLNFIPSFEVLLKRIKIYYQGEAGSFDFTYRDLDNIYSQSFSIDMTIDPDVDTADDYAGSDEHKVFTYWPGQDDEGDSPIGGFWKFKISDDGVDNYTVDRIEFVYWVEEILL